MCIFSHFHMCSQNTFTGSRGSNNDTFLMFFLHYLFEHLCYLEHLNKWSFWRIYWKCSQSKKHLSVLQIWSPFLDGILEIVGNILH